MIPYNQTSSVCLSNRINEKPNSKLELPVPAFPLRGRCNPYFLYLLPLLFLRFLIFLSLLGALICVVIIPRYYNNFINEVPEEYKSTRTAAIVIYSVGIVATLLTFMIELLNGCNIADSRYTPIFISFLDLFFALLFIGISIPIMIREFQIEREPSLFVNAVVKNAFLAAGIFGMSAVFFYLLHLFLSRFYQFCIGNYKNFKREFLFGSMPFGSNPSATQQTSLSSVSRVGIL